MKINSSILLSHIKDASFKFFCILNAWLTLGSINAWYISKPIPSMTGPEFVIGSFIIIIGGGFYNYLLQNNYEKSEGLF